MNNIVYIYGLVDPRKDKIFYIGFTQYLKKRYNVHLNVDGYRREKNLYKDNVIRKILNSGLKPQMIILDSCVKKFNVQKNMYEHDILERKYIKKYRDNGLVLTNLTTGGDGGRTYQRRVFQYTEDGEFIKEYESVNKVSENYGVGADIISKAIDQRGKKSYRGTYLFSSKEKANSFLFETTKKDNIPVIQYNNKGEYVREYGSQKEASLVTSIPQPNINHCLKGRRNHAGGFSWKYKNN